MAFLEVNFFKFVFISYFSIEMPRGNKECLEGLERLHAKKAHFVIMNNERKGDRFIIYGRFLEPARKLVQECL